ncbi:DUF1707 domain-containing protein [Yinghuangia sp. ASG 101]|uniref:DUF1707 SHOCT-like domain-containing protein n=1 Tax=Yinghuangia sp. ASG 101 TaxID=2896848 RepID=UPI001E36A7AB|nr:DUF1707 domain-containing protein [Yinghuangia sp. ASG 101]UGQ13052.1 DUF1707 domain-containing protein [Yinghuangia sp. ASG 101]
MLTQPAMRASDVDREAAVELLRIHHDQGRLTLDEYAERVGIAYAAVTLGELARLLKDLPPPEHLAYEVALIREAEARSLPVDLRRHRPRTPPSEDRDDAPAERHRRSVSGREVLRALWTAVLAVTAVNTGIWLLVLITHGPVYFWPIWVFGPPASVLGAVELCVRRHGTPPD